jgi:GNAT superfamily N-acetyltransferase
LPRQDERLSRAPRPVDAVAGRVRTRVDGDLDECVRLLEAVHRADAYPMYWPDDPARWLTPGAMLGAWVAEHEARIVGHIALRAGSADASARVWAEATGLPPEEFGSISRLFVSLECRGAGIGRELLDAACAEAAARGVHPALDVVETNRDAIRLYEQRGWRRVFSEPWAASDGNTLLHYYVAPLGNTNEKS